LVIEDKWGMVSLWHWDGCGLAGKGVEIFAGSIARCWQAVKCFGTLYWRQIMIGRWCTVNCHQ